MFFRRLAVLSLLTSVCFASIVDDVRAANAQNDFARAQAALDGYKSQHGVTPEYLEAMSWMARNALAVKKYDAAENYARQTESLARQMLYKRQLDAEPHL